MFIDARTLPEETLIETDVCIVGAGAAGITLAREFIGQPFRVILLESGALEYNQETQALYQGKNLGLPYYPLDAARLRYFGGTTNHWTGWCRPFDPSDFEVRPWIPYSGWPFARSHLEPFYARAQSICQLGPLAYDAGAWKTANSPDYSLPGDRVIVRVFQQSPPTRFGQVYRDEIERADNITTYLFANVVDIEITETVQMVTRLRVACLQGPKYWVAARLFILATGAIENARLLLMSNTVQKAGLGNHHDVVGRFFMEHPILESGAVLPSETYLPTALHLSKRYKMHNTSIRKLLALSAETVRREELVHINMELEPVSLAQVSKGFKSLRFLAREIRRGDMPDDFWQHIGNVIVDLDEVATGTYRKLFQSKRSGKVFQLVSGIEQAPNPASRVTLLKKQDRLGNPLVGLDWQLTPLDKRSVRRAHEILGEELGRAGLGRVKVTLDDDDTTWPTWLQGAFHHMGTTRMHSDPKQGVVSANCQVHGIANLFIAGSSVFPTSGSTTPTLTIVALALRLADHVKRLMT